VAVECKDGSIDEWRLRPQQVAQLFGVGLDALAEWADRGLLPCRRTVGGHRRYRQRDVMVLLDSEANVKI
jgi:excisionase family DNA binding protein